MILKRLKLFTIYVGPNGVAATDQQLRNIANGGAVNPAGQLALPAPNSAANVAPAAANAQVDPKPGANATTTTNANTNTGNGANTNTNVNTNTNTGNNANANTNTNTNTGNNANANTNTNTNTHKQELKNSYAQGAKRGEQAGMRKAGVWQGLKNTWRSAGTMKKIGMGGAALAGTYFLGKGLLGGNNNNDQ